MTLGCLAMHRLSRRSRVTSPLEQRMPSRHRAHIRATADLVDLQNFPVERRSNPNSDVGSNDPKASAGFRYLRQPMTQWAVGSLRVRLESIRNSMQDLNALAEVASSDLVVDDLRSSWGRPSSFRRSRGYGSLNRFLGGRLGADESVAKDLSWVECSAGP